MARGKQLEELVYDFRAEVGDSVSVNVGVDTLAGVKVLLRRVQETLYTAYQWPFLLVRPFPSITLAAGDYFYDIPEDVDPDHIDAVHLYRAGRVYPLERGVTPEHYGEYDSSADVRSDHVMRWDIGWTGEETQIEAWPIPATDGDKLFVIGHRPLNPLVEDSDLADLDGPLIVLFAAAEQLAMQGSKNAQNKLAAAQSRLAALTKRANGGNNTFSLNGAGAPRRTGHPVIRAPGT